MRPPLLQQSIDLSFWLGSQQQTCISGFAESARTGTDGWMDTVPLHRQCCAYYVGSADNAELAVLHNFTSLAAVHSLWQTAGGARH